MAGLNPLLSTFIKENKTKINRIKILNCFEGKFFGDHSVKRRKRNNTSRKKSAKMRAFFIFSHLLFKAHQINITFVFLFFYLTLYIILFLSDFYFFEKISQILNERTHPSDIVSLLQTLSFILWKRIDYGLIFVDGDDTEQLVWAIGEFKLASELNKPKIILVKGAPLDLSNELDLPIYFDQGGAIVAKLGIAQVPAKVLQKKNLLLVEELDLANAKEKK